MATKEEVLIKHRLKYCLIARMGERSKICFWCDCQLKIENPDRSLEGRTIDHIIPQFTAPEKKYDINNVVFCCERCNLERGDILCFYIRNVGLHRNLDEKNIKKAQRKIRKKLQKMIDLRNKWVIIEKNKLGYSIVENYNIETMKILDEIN